MAKNKSIFGFLFILIFFQCSLIIKCDEPEMDYYQLLGVSKDATSDEIKKAYRKLAKRIHPDLNKEDSLSEDKFKLLSEAYSVLSSSKRYDYDKEYQEYYKREEDYTPK